MNFKLKKSHLILIAILLLVFVLRTHGLERADVITDEVLIGIRSIGMIDFDAAETQTSPWQWFEKVPWWAHLSFHDHPSLVFLI